MEKIFKAKRLDNGEWHVFGFFDIGTTVIGERVMRIDSNYGETIWLDKYSICQYTGINDSEGNRIFEGDEVDTWEYGYNCGGMGNRMVKKIVGYKDGAFTNCLDRRNGVTLTGHNIHDRG